jgi:hypothetical protein
MSTILLSETGELIAAHPKKGSNLKKGGPEEKLVEIVDQRGFYQSLI